MWASSPKRATQLIFESVTNTGVPQTTMPSILHPTKGKVHHPPDILEGVAFYHRSMQTPKVQQYDAMQPPWESPTAPDSFPTEMRGTPTGSLDHCLTEQALNACLAGLKNNKSPGVDGVPYEVLKHLPHELRALILQLFRLLWQTGHTPRDWQHSQTHLFLKRLPAHDNANYRPIAIHITMFKLWTRFVTHVLQEYAETHRLLSPSQDGFRTKRGTSHSLQYLTLLLEDARRHKRDFFIAELDMKAAFSSIDHSKLFAVMQKLGFTPDAIRAVQGIYAGATTSIITPHGATEPLPWGPFAAAGSRGTPCPLSSSSSSKNKISTLWPAAWSVG
jgi:hypothetical protein